MDKNIGEQIFGIDCYRPDVRATSTISSPVRPTNRMDKVREDLILSNNICAIYCYFNLTALLDNRAEIVRDIV